MILYSKNIYMEDGCKSGYLEIIDGKFKNFYSNECVINEDVNYGDKIIIPGIFDTHNHGGFGVRINDGCTEEEVKIYLKGLASVGVTAVFPTTFELEGMETVAKMSKVQQDGARIMGIHSEGPWGARVGEKGINTGYPKVDMEYAKRMLEVSDGKLKLVAIAPEVEGAGEAIDYFKENGIKIAIYHTNANYKQANIGIDRGITVATHLGNVMTGLHHRDVGTMGACLLRDEVDCEIICDGLHVSLPMLQIIFKVKDKDKIMLVSDNVEYAGAPVGHYRKGNLPSDSDRSIIEVTEEGFVLSKSGRLSGSSKPVIYGMKNLVQKLDMSLEDVIRFSSYNPCEVYGFAKEKGSIKLGKDADFVVIDSDFNVYETYCEGRKVYDKSIDSVIFNQKFLDKFKI